jgi:hypothetical protein
MMLAAGIVTVSEGRFQRYRANVSLMMAVPRSSRRTARRARGAV